MKIETVKLLRAFDRDTGAALLLNGKVIAETNYDEHGSGGEHMLEGILDRLAKMAGVYPDQDEVDDDEFLKIVDGDDDE